MKSNRQIASRLGVSAMTVGRWINEFESTVTNVIVRDETVGADGKVRKKKAPSRTKSVERTGKPLITKEGKKVFRSIMTLGTGVSKAPSDTKQRLLEDIELAQQYLDELRKSLE